MFKLSGTLTVKEDTIQVSEKFSKREFVVTDSSGMYPQEILFQLAQDKCSLIDSVNIGETIDVSFNLQGRSWVSPQGETKYFNTLSAWRIEKVGTQQTGSQPSLPKTPAAVADDSDDLPF